MTEESIFTAALENQSKAERTAFLAEACNGDEALQRRVEALLESHEKTEFLRTSAAERAANAFGEEGSVGTTELAVEDFQDVPLDFLAPSEKPESLGRLGPYEVLEVIGRGGMGVVLRAFDESLHRVVAIKVMARELATSAAARRRFAREAQAAAAVSHDHVVTIHAVEQAEGLPYLVMQYVAGISLQERLDQRGPLQVHEILRIGMQTASGLAAAHAQGLVHRDIKPANILLENGVERVKITDFGLARAVDDASLTQSGVVAGTPQYMAPEQARGEAVDQRADLFSLGSVLYAMCTGRAPFRASGTMAVLKRVCEDDPGAIRQSNPEIPEWLVRIVAKLQAKDPSDRYQSAAEVAGALGQCLSHVQDPSVVPLPHMDGSERPRASRRRLMAAALALFTLLCGFGFAEATGVSHLTTTVIRILTPDGTLVVETNDPDVRVTIEGDGGLSITDAGPQVVRLRPGSYQLHASKDGKPVPLDRELVKITRSGRQVVSVRLEGGASGIMRADEVTPSAERGAFVLTERGPRAARAYDTLPEAIEHSEDGDTIEIRGNGPFIIPHLEIRHELTIRASEGYAPLLTDTPRTRVPGSGELIRAKARLTLEGLAIRSRSAAFEVVQTDDLFYAASCRFEIRGALATCINGSMTCLRNCEVYAPNGAPIGIECYGQRTSFIENSVLVGHVNFTEGELKRMAVVRLSRNTFVSWTSSFLHLLYMPRAELDAPPSDRIRVFNSENVFDSPGAVLSHIQPMELGPVLSVEQAESWLALRVDWRESRNVYRTTDVPMLAFELVQGKTAARRCETVSEWENFWGIEGTGSLRGEVRFEADDPIGKSRSNLAQLKPQDFRLRPGSAGHRARPDGKDLGADVDLVGPGPAYERWKQTPEYKKWREESGQRQVARPEAESKSFAVLAGAGVDERKFGTLAEAVIRSSDGDTIEVRGNGPYVIDSIAISGHPVTIRAGHGYRPVIRLSQKDVRAFAPLLRATAPLVLEGLEFQRLVGEPSKEGEPWPGLIVTQGSPLYVANCLFRSNCVSPGRVDLITGDSPVCYVRNCALLCPADVSIGVNFPPCRSLTIENCVHLGRFVLSCGFGDDPRDEPVVVRLMRNTVVSTDTPAIHTSGAAELFRTPGNGPRARLETAGNIFDVHRVLQFNQGELNLEPRELEGFLRRVLIWQDRDNLIRPREGLMLWSTGDKALPPFGPRDVAEWKTYWNEQDASIREGAVRYDGGNLLFRMATDLENIAPADFRLRPDSAGYRAGPGGKDLGADVDLVGPGPAYERWKKTPEYQKWLVEIRPQK